MKKKRTISFKKMAIYGIVVILAGASATWGLKTLTYRGVFNPVEVETTYGPIKLTMSLDKTTYKVGESINITLKLTNIGSKTIFLSRSSPPVLDFVVYNKTDQPIYAYSWGGFIAVVVSYPIKPGESLNRTFAWDQQEKIASYPETIYQQVDNGAYFIVGRTTPGGSVLYDDEGKIKQIAIDTQEIQIEIES